MNVIINADDYGLAPGVSQAIRDLIVAQRLTATSCMTQSDFWFDEGPKLLALDLTNVSIGLHFTLTDQRACLSTPTLAPNRDLPSLGGLWRGAITGTISSSDVAAELHEQLRRFEVVFGRPPDHIDGHHHVQHLPAVRQCVLDTWSKGLVTENCWLRVSTDTMPRMVRRRTALAKSMMIGFSGIGLRSRAMAMGIPVNDGFSGIYDLSGQTDFAQVIERAVSVDAPNLVLMCHPGYVDDALASRDTLVDQREIEAQFLASEAFSEILASYNVKLVASPALGP